MFLLLPAIAKNKLPLIVEVSFRYRAVQTPLYAFSISAVGQPFQFQQHMGFQVHEKQLLRGKFVLLYRSQ